jgi:hypothetical protein
MGPHYSELEVDLKPMGGEQEEAAQGELRKTLTRFLVSLSLSTPSYRSAFRRLSLDIPPPSS